MWAPLVAGVGWGFGALLARYAPVVHRGEHWLMGGLVLTALAAHGVRRWRELTRSRTLAR